MIWRGGVVVIGFVVYLCGSAACDTHSRIVLGHWKFFIQTHSDIVVFIVLLLLLTVFVVSARLVVGEIPLFSFVDCSLVRSFDFFPTILYLCYNQSQGTVVD